MFVPVRLAFVIRAADSSEIPSADNFFRNPPMPGVASLLFVLMDEFPCLDLVKVRYPLGAAKVFSEIFVIVLETMIVLALLELLRSELLVLIELC